MTNIYLAGKIAKNDWRHSVVPGLRGATTDRNSLGPDEEIPTLLETTFGDLSYVGPFFAGCDHGCAHSGDTHGRAGGCTFGHRRVRTAQDCLTQIRKADLVFVWLDELDPAARHSTAYGTLVELGYAVGHDKTVIAAASRAPYDPLNSEVTQVDRHAMDDLWFAWTLASHRLLAESPQRAFEKVAGSLREFTNQPFL